MATLTGDGWALIEDLASPEREHRRELLAAGVPVRAIASLYPPQWPNFVGSMAEAIASRMSGRPLNAGQWNLLDILATDSINHLMRTEEEFAPARANHTRLAEVEASRLSHTLWRWDTRDRASTHASHLLAGGYVAYWLLSHPEQLASMQYAVKILPLLSEAADTRA